MASIRWQRSAVGQARKRRLAACRKVALAVLAMTAIAVPSAGEAGVPSWASKPYEYMVVDQDLRTVLEEFGRNLGMPVTMTQAVQGRVRGVMPRASAGAFLDALSRAYGLDWYFDGYALAVSSTGESRIRFIDLHDLSFERALAGVQAVGLADPRYQLRAGPSPGVAMVSGPPRFIELVSETVGAMTRKPAPEASAVVQVYRGGSAVEKVVFPAPKRE